MEDPRKSVQNINNMKTNHTNQQDGEISRNSQTFQDFLNLQYYDAQKKNSNAPVNQKEGKDNEKNIPMNGGEIFQNNKDDFQKYFQAPLPSKQTQNKKEQKNEIQSIIGDYLKQNQKTESHNPETELKIKYIIEHLPDVAEDVKVMTPQQIDEFYKELKTAEQADAKKDMESSNGLTAEQMVLQILPYIELTKQQLLQKSYSEIKNIYNGLITMIQKNKELEKNKENFLYKEQTKEISRTKDKKRKVKENQVSQVGPEKKKKRNFMKDENDTVIVSKKEVKSNKKSKSSHPEKEDINKIRNILMQAMGSKLAKKVKEIDDETLLAMYLDIQKEEQEMKDKKQTPNQDETIKQMVEEERVLPKKKQKLLQIKGIKDMKGLQETPNQKQETQKQECKRNYSITQMTGEYDQQGNLIFEKNQYPAKLLCLNDNSFQRKNLIQQDLKAITRVMTMMRDQENE